MEIGVKFGSVSLTSPFEAVGRFLLTVVRFSSLSFPYNKLKIGLVMASGGGYHCFGASILGCLILTCSYLDSGVSCIVKNEALGCPFLHTVSCIGSICILVGILRADLWYGGFC